jgi:hypothetical protein
MMTWLEEAYLAKAFHRNAYELNILDISESEQQ